MPVADRVAVQGSADLLMSFCGAMASFSSGFIREAWGYHVLAQLGMIAAGVLAVAAVTTHPVHPPRRPPRTRRGGGRRRDG